MSRVVGLLIIVFVPFAQVWALSFDEATALVEKSLANTEIAGVQHYCLKGTMTCRSMYTLKDKTTGAPVDAFFDSFYSADRRVGSTCYFIPSANGYHQLSDTVFDGKLAIDDIPGDSVQIVNSADRREFQGLYFKRLGTSRFLLGRLIHTDASVVLDATEYDSTDPNYKVAVRSEYLRIYP